MTRQSRAPQIAAARQYAEVGGITADPAMMEIAICTLATPFAVVCFFGLPGTAKSVLASCLAKQLDPINFRQYDTTITDWDTLGGILLPQDGRLEYIDTPGSCLRSEAIVIEEINRVIPLIQGKWLGLVEPPHRYDGRATRIRYVFVTGNSLNMGREEGVVRQSHALASRITVSLPAMPLDNMPDDQAIQVIQRGGTPGDQPPIPLPDTIQAIRDEAERIRATAEPRIAVAVLKSLRAWNAANPPLPFQQRRARRMFELFLHVVAYRRLANNVTADDIDFAIISHLVEPILEAGLSNVAGLTSADESAIETAQDAAADAFRKELLGSATVPLHRPGHDFVAANGRCDEVEVALKAAIASREPRSLADAMARLSGLAHGVMRNRAQLPPTLAHRVLAHYADWFGAFSASPDESSALIAALRNSVAEVSGQTIDAGTAAALLKRHGHTLN